MSQGDEAPEQLLANPLNWRVHPQFQQQAMTQTLDTLGWVQRVIVNQTTGHVIDGHLRVAVAISRGEKSVPVSYVKLSPDEERLALATFDPLASLAVADDQALQALLKEVAPYAEGEELQKLLAQLSQGSLIELGGEPSLEGLLQGEEEKAPQPGITEDEGQRLDETGRGIAEQPPDKLEALRARWGVEMGQVWLIPSGTLQGQDHLLVVGDCTDPAVVELVTKRVNALSERTESNPTPMGASAHPRDRVLPGANSAILVTSPPYGMGQTYETAYVERKATPHKGKGDRLSRDNVGGRPSEEVVAEWLALITKFTQAWAPVVAAACIDLADHVVAPRPGYGRHTYGDLVRAAEKAGWPLVATRFWHKGANWGTNAYWLSTYKPVVEFEFIGFFANLDVFPTKRISERVPQSEAWRFRSLWEFGTVASQQMDRGFHPTAFPLELPRRCLLLFTDQGGVVVDPFLGSGTTMVAAEGLGRLCLGVEQSPTFAAMTLERMTRFGLSPRNADA